MIALVWSILLAATGLVYAAWVRWVVGGLRHLPPGRSEETPPISLVVPARNEAVHLPETLASIARQDYPTDHLEVLLVNDRSTDETPQIMRRWAAEQPFAVAVLDVEETPAGASPKKHAVHQAIRRARGEVIVTTDADTRHDPSWLRGLARHFEPGVGLVAGLAMRKEPDEEAPLWQRVEAVDFLSIKFMSAGAIGRGQAYTCIASNLAYRKAAFDAVGGFGDGAHVVTGDDDMLLQAVHAHPAWQVRYATEPETFVETEPPPTFAALLHQRSRWASVGTQYRGGLMALLVNAFVFYLLLALALPLSLTSWSIAPPAYVAWPLFALKLAVDARAVHKGSRRFGLSGYDRYILPAEFLNLPLILAATIIGHFGTFSWKGNRYRRTVGS